MNKISIYIHWPFCKSKCPYCDFNSHVREKIDLSKWKEAYLKEIDKNKEHIQNRKITSIFFGGGTPSLMPTDILASILDKIAELGNIDSSTEITFEANPTSVEIQKFKEFAATGINRVSIGVQSFNENDLKFLGREHSLKEAIEAIEIAKKYFKRYSFDLIYALPTQTLKSWENELRSALKYADKHISLYQLTIEKGTPFYSSWKKKKFVMPGEEQAKDFYLLTQEIMDKENLSAYEISNHAQKGEECLHNLAYWQYDEFIGIGPGAHGRVSNSAINAIYHPENWLSNALEGKSTHQNNIKLSKQEQIEEMLLMGLRLTKGINQNDFKAKTGISFIDLNQQKLEWFLQNKYVEIVDNCLRATYSGKLVLNHIIAELIPT